MKAAVDQGMLKSGLPWTPTSNYVAHFQQLNDTLNKHFLQRQAASAASSPKVSPSTAPFSCSFQRPQGYGQKMMSGVFAERPEGAAGLPGGLWWKAPAGVPLRPAPAAPGTAFQGPY